MLNIDNAKVVKNRYYNDDLVNDYFCNLPKNVDPVLKKGLETYIGIGDYYQKIALILLIDAGYSPIGNENDRLEDLGYFIYFYLETDKK